MKRAFRQLLRRRLNLGQPSHVRRRLLGQSYVKSITVRISDSVSDASAEAGIISLLTQRHGRKDFYTFNASSIKETIDIRVYARMVTARAGEVVGDF